ncbi:hypothetical protein, partial [Escherichia coli]|uniref:hypothetical protein n=1 Tax=Escherichia coli TaxID=562 RepID=UPI001BFE8F0F
DDADPIMEAVTALRAACVAMAPIGDELDRTHCRPLVPQSGSSAPSATGGFATFRFRARWH